MVPLIILGCVAVLALGGCAYLFYALGLERQKVELADKLTASTKEQLTLQQVENAAISARLEVIPKLEQEIDMHKDDIAEKDKQILALRLDAERLDEKLKSLEEAEERLRTGFAEMAQQAMKENAEQFLTLAKTKFEGLNKEGVQELGKKEKAIADMLTPIQERLAKLDESTRAIEKERSEAYGSLTEQVKNMMESQQKLGVETRRLVTALRNPAQRGQWGEIQLRRVVEMAGMVEHCDFEAQVTREGEDGKLRPDIVVQLPNDRVIVVDAKVPYEAYSRAIETENEDERRVLYADHARQVRQHIEKLSRKSYHQQFEKTPEFVVMFLPAEPMFSAALEHAPDLIDFGVGNKVLICTPITLIALLKSVASGWRHEQLHENAVQIGQMARDLHRRVGKLASNFSKLGRMLNSSVTAYNDTVGSLEGSVLPQMRKFKELDAAIDQEIEEPKPIDERSRTLQAPELRKQTPALPAAIGSLFDIN